MKQQDFSSSPSATDDAVDRVLGNIRDVKPSPELERNVLHAVQRRLTAESTRAHNWRSLHSLLPCLTMVVLVCVLVNFSPLCREAFFPKRQVTTLPAQRLEAGQTAPLQKQEVKLVQQERGTKTDARIQRQVSSVPPRIVDMRPVSDPLSASGQVHPTAWEALPSAELAALEAAAPSQLEPPLPITVDELQIRRFTQRHHAYQLAAMAPQAEGVHERAETAEFQRFFAPHPEPSGNLPLPQTSSLPDPK